MKIILVTLLSRRVFFFPWGWSSRGVKLTTHLHLVPSSRMRELFLHSPNTSPWRVIG